MEGQLKWQNQKQQRQVELERHVLQQRELTCVRHERRGQQFDERLLARSNAVDGDRAEIDNARAVQTAELHSAREAQFCIPPKTNIFKDLHFHLLVTFIRLHFQFIRTFCMRSTGRR
jgi:hypothetical protein